MLKVINAITNIILNNHPAYSDVTADTVKFNIITGEGKMKAVLLAGPCQWCL